MNGQAEPKGATGTPTTVFVSYARDDRKRALPVIELLETAGFSVWWDGLLEGGERFFETTATALDGARAVVVLWSKTSVASHWVHDEATAARDRRVLVPLSIDGTEPPLGFRQFQVIDVSHSRMKPGDADADRLVRAVAALHDGAPVAKAAAKPAAGGVDRRWLLGGGIAAALVGGIGVAWRSGMFAPAAGTANSIAVLPFVNLGGDPAQSYFSDGLATEVRTELARNPMLQVAAQASSNKFRDRAEDAKTIASTLGVAYLLDGSIRRAGDTLRIAAELIDGRSGFSKWAQSFDRPIADVFAVQAEIASAVMAALSAEVGGQDGGAAGAQANGTTTNIAAFDAFLRGRDLFGQGSGEASDRAALAKFDAAIAADPDYGLAHAARSRTLTVIANQYVQGAARRALYDEALAAAKRATDVAPQSADAWSALGFVLFNGRLDARGAVAPYDRSFDLGGGDADVLSRYALFCARIGRFDKARTAMARSAGLDPLNGRTVRLQGEVEFVARRFAQAVPLIERALVINPTLGVARSALGACRFLLGDKVGAEAAYAAEPNRLFGLTGLAIVRQAMGRRAEAAQDLAALIAEHGDNSLYQQAQVAAQWGDTGRVMPLLMSAQTEGDAGIMYARNDPFLDPVRGDPAFKQLLISLGFA
jgi:TolB-like protein/tetratricopeptide (TPR) repeat protein